eukprot:GHRR01035911.1.p2 GENE.GHRR01035911.1~~GHRR01035911.1.p2  ORF type:complete len:109 (+),score=34.07 GHRR01035911.1:495-821(+)
MDRGIYFDEDNRVRILDVDKYAASQTLQDNCQKFTSNMQQLQDCISKYLSAIDQQVDRIEKEKLKAVGLRNRVAAMHEVGSSATLPLSGMQLCSSPCSCSLQHKAPVA